MNRSDLISVQDYINMRRKGQFNRAAWNQIRSLRLADHTVQYYCYQPQLDRYDQLISEAESPEQLQNLETLRNRLILCGPDEQPTLEGINYMTEILGGSNG